MTFTEFCKAIDQYPETYTGGYRVWNSDYTDEIIVKGTGDTKILYQDNKCACATTVNVHDERVIIVATYNNFQAEYMNDPSIGFVLDPNVVINSLKNGEYDLDRMPIFTPDQQNMRMDQTVAAFGTFLDDVSKFLNGLNGKDDK